jgi:imidazolonepropionase-like amidohydrolase
VIDGSGRDPEPDWSILIEDGIIREVGPSHSVRSGSEAIRVIDASGQFVVPGLMDMHIHMCIPCHPDEPSCDVPGTTERSVSLAAAFGLNNARALISRGITTVRDVGSHGHSIFAVKQLVDSGQAPGPRIVPCGRALASTGGHAPLIAVPADGPDEVRKAARTELLAGAEALKLMASGSGASERESPYDMHLSQDELRAAIEVAKGLGKTTAVHSTNTHSARNAVLAGADSIEHGLIIEDAELILMRDSGVFLDPTVWAYRFVGDHGKYLSTTERVMAAVRSRYENHMAVVARARQLGIPIVAGTDSALPVNPPESLFWEMEWLVRCGLTPMETLQAATCRSARLLGRESEFGTLEAGKTADILMVADDPMSDVANLARTNMVFKGGELFVNQGQLTWPDAIRENRPRPPGPLPVSQPALDR